MDNAISNLEPSSIRLSTRGIQVMKFGGTSMAGAQGIRRTAQRVREALEDRRVLVVASAMAGVTDLLTKAAEGRSDVLERFRFTHREVLASLAPEIGESFTKGLENRLRDLEEELARLLQGIALLGDCSTRVFARLCSLGERASSALLCGVLDARGEPCLELDPTQVVACNGNVLEANPRPELIRERLACFREGVAPLALLPGFFGGDAGGDPVLLGRGGSDLSAALAAQALDAELLEIWTDVDGVFTADPRLVKDAKCLPEISYEEAMELAHFGAKVLHPRTLAPVRGLRIPVRVCNSLKPELPGTLVKARSKPIEGARGLSLLPGVALLDVAGPGLKGVPGVAARAFGALAAGGINVVLITQGSSECAITICVKGAEARSAREALQSAFEGELAAGLMDPLDVRSGLAVLSLVGDGLVHQTGAAGAFFSALGQRGCNVVAIAQGSSERSISTVVTEAEAAQALRAVHRRFFGTPEPLDLYLLGVGLVGRQFLVQLQRLRDRLPTQAETLRLCAVADSRRMLLEPSGLEPTEALEALADRGEALDLARLRAFAQTRCANHPVLVDCTSAQAVAEAYTAFVEADFHLVSASKKANSGPLGAYRELRKGLARRGRRFHYETNVGAGLPILGPLRDLQHGGDRILRLEGILSGSLSALLGKLEGGMSFSEAVRWAKEAGFTEPDPREDLSGLDVARKALILHREMGGALELEDVSVQGVLPVDFDANGSVEAFLERLEELDEAFRQRIETLHAEGRCLRYVATLSPEGCWAGLVALAREHPLCAIKDGENALCFYTEAYDPHPMVVRGYGAGATVTAAGVLADVLRIASEVRA